MTLLDIVTDILNSMDSDEVNTITETIESDQIAKIVKTTYFELISRRDWPHLKELFQLTASGDSNRPSHMSMPDNVMELREVRYNKRTSTDTKDKYEHVRYVFPEEFLTITNSRNSDASNIDTVTDYSGVDLYIRNDAAPTYYTSFDDDNLVFDSYDSVVDSTLQASKTQCFGIRQPTWTNSDTFIPDLPSEAFSLLVAEAKSVAQFQVRQFQDVKAEQQAQRQRFRMSQQSWRAHKQDRYPNYGRRHVRRSVPPRD